MKPRLRSHGSYGSLPVPSVQDTQPLSADQRRLCSMAPTLRRLLTVSHVSARFNAPTVHYGGPCHPGNDVHSCPDAVLLAKSPSKRWKVSCS